MRSVAFRVCRLQVLRTRALAPRRQGYNYDYCGSALAPRRQGYNNDKYCALARLPPDGRAAPRRQSYNYEYCALARLPPDDRATIKTNTAHARLPPDDRAAPRRPGLLHCTHAKRECIRVSYHQIYGGTRCKLEDEYAEKLASRAQATGADMSPWACTLGKSYSCDQYLGPPTREFGAFSPSSNRPVACVV